MTNGHNKTYVMFNSLNECPLFHIEKKINILTNWNNTVCSNGENADSKSVTGNICLPRVLIINYPSR